MDCTLKPGDRIRVTVGNRMHGYRPGDKGTVLRAFMGSETGNIFYFVAMDKDDLTITGAIFAGGKIEPDV